METLIFDKTAEVRKNKVELEKKLNVKITITGRKVDFSGEAIDEYEALNVLEAINFGFSAKKALILKESDTSFQHINIRKFTRRKNLDDVRARVIGSEGKTKRTFEELADCSIVVKGNVVAIIGLASNIDLVVTALTNLIRGSKQANVYNFLERMNSSKRKLGEDLGLKKSKEEEEEAEDEIDED